MLRHPSGKQVFLCHRNELVKQQFESIKKNLRDIDVVKVLSVSDKDVKMWEFLYTRFNVFVMTIEKFINVLNSFPGPE